MSTPQVFAGKVIIITGSANGIGLATAKHLAARGADLSLSDIKPEALQTAVWSIEEDSPDAKVLHSVVDVSNTEEVANWVAKTKVQFGKIDGCVNNAGMPAFSYMIGYFR
jgi:NAD(P)-dependent dehydrogenase (short-subunit alcohol dehydrogenase family)